MGKLAPIWFGILATFLVAVLAGCALEISAGNVRFLDDTKEQPADAGDIENDPAG